jgi:hypothetical protein
MLNIAHNASASGTYRQHLRSPEVGFAAANNCPSAELYSTKRSSEGCTVATRIKSMGTR